MKKCLISLSILFLLCTGCYKSWNGLHFEYSEIKKGYQDLNDLSKKAENAQLFVVKYGTSQFPESSLYYRGASDRVPFDWLFYLLKSDKFIMLIDTGFSDAALARQFGVTLADPLELLAGQGIEPADVTHVIITHAHFDHIGLVAAYENAQVIIQEEALDAFYASGQDRQAAETLKKSEHLETYSDKLVLFDSILLSVSGGHAPGVSSVFFKLKGEKIAILGDEAYFLANVTEQKPVGTYVDLDKNRAFLKEMQTLDAHFLTFHDPAISPEELGVYPLEF